MMRNLFEKMLSVILVIVIAVASCLTVSAATVNESESNDTYATADTVTLGNKISGTISKDDDNDFYKITAPANGKITLKFCHTYRDSKGSYDAWHVWIYQYSNGSYSELSYNYIYCTDNEKISLPYIGAVKNGVYYIKVAPDSNRIVGDNYNIVTSFTKSNYFEKEMNATYSSATPIILGKSYSGNINSSNDNDFYKITAPASGKIALDFCHTYRDSKGSYDAWHVWVYQYRNGSYSELSYNYIYATDNKKISLPYIGAVKNGVYYIKVAPDSNRIVGDNYTINASVYIPTPKLTAIANTASGVKVTWGKVSGADKYYVYRKVKGGSYSNIGTTSKTYFTDKKAKSGKIYYYVVKAENEAGKSANSNYKTIKYLADPTLKTPTSAKIGITLKWSKVTGAQGYIVYRKTGNGGYTKLKTEKGVSNLSYVDESAKKGKKYTYKVRAYYSKTYSAFSNTKTIKDKY